MSAIDIQFARLKVNTLMQLRGTRREHHSLSRDSQAQHLLCGRFVLPVVPVTACTESPLHLTLVGPVNYKNTSPSQHSSPLSSDRREWASRTGRVQTISLEATEVSFTHLSHHPSSQG